MLVGVCWGWWGNRCLAAPLFCAYCPLGAWGFGVRVSRVGVVGVGGGSVCRAGRRGGAGQLCPAPYSVVLGCFGRPVAWGEAGVFTLGVLTRARTRAERGIDGRGPRGADRGGPGGGAGWWRGLGGSTRWRRQAPKAEGEQKLALLGRGRGALPAVVAVLAVGARGGCGSWWRRVGWGLCPLSAGVAVQEGRGVVGDRASGRAGVAWLGARGGGR